MPETEVVLCRGWRGVSAFAVQSLRALRARDPLALASALVLVPTAAASHLFRRSLDDALLQKRSAAILPTIATPASLVSDLVERSGGRIRLVDPLLREALLERAFEEAKAEGAVPPFVVRSGLAIHVLAFYDDLLSRSPSGGLEPFFAAALEELDAPDDEGATKLVAETRFLQASLDRYQRGLTSLGLVDPPQARLRLRDEPFPYRQVLALGSETLAPIDLELLGSAPGIDLVTVAVVESSEEIPETLARRASTVRAFPGEPPAPPRLLAPPEASGSGLSFVARDREEALRDVTRLLKLLEDDGRLPPLHRIAIVVPRPLPYLYLAKKVLSEAGVPFQLQDSFPLATEPYLAAVDVVLELVATRAHREAVLALLRSPFFAFASVSPAEVAAFDELTQRFREPGGVERWRALHARLARPPLQPSLPGIGEGSSGRALAAIAAIVHANEALTVLGETGPVSAKIDGLRSFLRSFGRPLEDVVPSSDADEDSRPYRARAALDSILERFQRAAELVGDPDLDLHGFRDKLRRAIESHTFALRTGTGGVQVVDARSAAFGSFDLVVLVGLNEGEWPARSDRNIFYPQWLLRDFGWPSDRELLARERRRFTGLLGLSSKRVALFRHQLEDETPTVASPFLDDAAASFGGDGRSSEHVGARLSEILVSRAEALRHGLVSPPADLVRSRRPGEVGGRLTVSEPVSPTALELYLRCPFKYFSQHLLGLEEEEDVDETLTPLEHGRILHELLKDAFDEWDRGREAPRPIEPESYDEALALFRRVALPKIPPEHRGIEMERLFGGAGELGAIPWLLRSEMSRGRPTRRLVEQAFQSALRVDEGPLGEKPWYVRIKGRVDRADVDEDGFLHVLDYKSGRAPAPSVTLQVPLYAMCLATELSIPVREATYLSFRDRKSTSRADFGKAQELLVRSFGAIQEGRFGPRPYQVHLCNSCGFVGVCRKEIEESPPGAKSESGPGSEVQS
jgi:RecB family exonuclease